MSALADEASLLARARAGDQAAFADLVSRNRAKLWSICLRITGNAYDAEDALQEALTAAWLNLDRFRLDAAFSTWCYRIAANASLAVVKKRRDIPTDAFEHLDQPMAPDVARSVVDRDQINAALGRLPVQFREALVLREYGDFSYEQIAAHQGVGVQTVKSRLNRARAALAADLLAQQ